MKIFFFFSILHELYARVAMRMQATRPDMAFGGFVYGRDQIKVLRESGFPCGEVEAFTEFLSRHLDGHEPDIAALTRWEARHVVSLSYLLAADRRYWGMGRRETLRIASLVIRFVQDALNRTQPDIVVAEGIDCLLSYVLYYEARERNVPFLITYASPMPGYFALYSNPQNRWEEVDENYAVLRPSTLSREQVQRADEVIASYTRERVVPSYMAAYRRLFNPRRDARIMAAVLRRNLSDPMHRYNPSYQGHPAVVVMRRIQRITRPLWTNLTTFDNPVAGEKFVLFPLQLQPEASTLVFAPFFTDQIYGAECLSKSLPIDCLLYVKEHPVMAGRRSLSEYRRLKALPNVRVISPSVNSHDLIKHAAAVVTITSTIGWEAAIYQKPVIVLGNVWYDSFDVVRKLRAIGSLPDELRAALTTDTPDVDLLRKAILATLAGTYRGEIEHPTFNPSVLENHNVSAIADALLNRIARSSAVAVQSRVRT